MLSRAVLPVRLLALLAARREGERSRGVAVRAAGSIRE